MIAHEIVLSKPGAAMAGDRSTSFAPLRTAPSLVLLSYAPLSSIGCRERDFARRRQTRQKGPEDDGSAQRAEIGNHDTLEIAQKTAFLLANVAAVVSMTPVKPLR